MLIAGAMLAGICLSSVNCFNVKVDRGAFQVPGYTWPPENDPPDRDDNDRQLP
jgi:hypothetical protein